MDRQNAGPVAACLVAQLEHGADFPLDAAVEGSVVRAGKIVLDVYRVEGIQDVEEPQTRPEVSILALPT